MFTSISYKSMVQSREVELDLDGNPASNKCKCSQKEDYCWFSDCESSDCESTYTGCGIAWGSPCDGRCN
ncbi:bacteriocin fulvocin C-related protein [Flavobacteriaceae bacterium M23B6Z8]